MATERNRPILTHIHDAEAWLSKARASYLSNNRVRGELDLSLAQAETKYAWELSREALASPPAGRGPRAGGSGLNGLRRWWMPLAACLGLGLAAAFLLPRLQEDTQGSLAQNQPAEPAAREEKTLAAAGGPEESATAPRHAAAGQRKTATLPGDAAKGGGSSKQAPGESGEAPEPERNEDPPAQIASAPAIPVPDQAAPVAVAPPAAVPRPETEMKPAATGHNLGIDLGELERVAMETLTADGINGK